MQADSSHACPALVEDQPVEVLGEVAKGQFRIGAGQADGADEQPKPVLLMGEDVFDMRADRGFGSVDPGGCLRHWLAYVCADEFGT